MTVEFRDNSIKVKAALNEAVIAYLYEAAGELEAETKRNTRVDTSNTKNSWSYIVDTNKGEAVIGNPLENAIWEEFGTGEYALNGKGRKGGWVYVDAKGKGHYTKGKKPSRAMYKAFIALKAKLVNRAQEVLKARMQS